MPRHALKPLLRALAPALKRAALPCQVKTGLALTSCLLAASLLAAPNACAHFGMVIPSADIVQTKKDAALEVAIAFAHPMEMAGMPMEKPVRVDLAGPQGTVSLFDQLEETRFLDHKAWSLQHTLARPGVYTLAVEPAPYWEEAEDCYIVHYTKVVVPAFGDEEGWDKPLGLKTEIVPLTRPFGNYAGNLFQGQVLLDGKPVAGCDVEVELYNQDKKYAAPNAYLVTQVVKTDANGIFSFVPPFAGWWGFAALNTSDQKLDYQGTPKDVELGAVLWSRFVAPKLQ